MMALTNSRFSRTITLLVIMALNCSFAHSKIIYVDDNATGANDGTSWANAYVYLQDALEDANTSEKPMEIKVAQGIYKPDKGSGSIVGDRQATFKLINNVILKGGFAGIGELDPDVRDVEVYETILSGDLNGDDVEVAELRDLLKEPTRAENCYYVVTGSRTDKTAVLDGLVIIGGNNNGDPYDDRFRKGGGVYNYSGSPTLTNCTFSANSAQIGGGMCNWENSSPILTNCTFIRNFAFGGSGIWNQDNSNPILTNCTFIENQSDDAGGGGMVNEESNPTLTNCKFIGNRSVDGGWFGYGAGMRNLDSSPVLTDCTFIANGGGNAAAGIYNCCDDGRCAPTLINCIFSQNDDSAIVNQGRRENYCNPTLINCIFSENSARGNGGGIQNNASHLSLTNCTFNDNSAHSGGGIYDSSGILLVTNCMFRGNSAEAEGGGIYGGSSTLTNCTFTGNLARYGGGISNRGGISILIDCIFSGNSAANGGAVKNSGQSIPIMKNCTFSGNDAIFGGGMYNVGAKPTLTNCTFSRNSAEKGSGMWNVNANPTLTNCILWDGGNEIWDQHDSDITITYSNIQGGFPGKGNINADPLFVDLDYWYDNNTPGDSSDDYWVDGDYHLKSQAGRFDLIAQTWIQDDVTSPCIDTGDPNSSTAFEPSPNGNRINMGAYGGTAEASKSPLTALKLNTVLTKPGG